MNNQAARRLVLVGLCVLAAAPAAPAQQRRVAPPGQQGFPPPLPETFAPADTAHPSHKPLDIPIGDLNGAEDALSRRLRHTQNLEELKDLLKDGLKNDKVRQMVKEELQKKFKSDNPDDADKHLDDLLNMVRDNPQLLDDPSLRGLLDDPKLQGLLDDGKGVKDPDDLPADKKKQLADIAQGLIEKNIKQPDPDPDKGPNGGEPPGASRPPGPAPPPPPVMPPRTTTTPAPEAESKPSWISRDMIDGFAGLVKDIDKSSDGESLRTALREIARMDPGPSGSSDLSGFFKGILSPEDAGWLARNLKPPDAPNLGGWSRPAAFASPSVGASSGNAMDGLLWVALLALLGLAGWIVWTMARRQQDAARARGRAWSPGPWPVHPSQVSTREELIRAFEHLAYLLLGPTARSLNHLDLASRLGERDHGRHGAAARLGRLYEQARYAPPQEPLPADELAAARGDLSALAGAAA